MRPAPAPRVATRRRVALVALAAGAAAALTVSAYVIARQTSLFALRTIHVEGATPGVAGAVRKALAPYVGTSLVAFDVSRARRRLASLPTISRVSLDRAFPHTLEVRVRLERPVAVLRQGAAAWLVSASARVLARLDPKPKPYPKLPRIWIPRGVDVEVNSTLAEPGAAGVAAVGRPQLLDGGVVRSVRTEPGQLTLVLAGGRQVRLGDTADLRLKLAIARRILPLATGAAYVDVTIPERPVAGYNSQVGG
jgi:cell division protein FtsQ